MSEQTKLKCERYSTGKYMVYSTGEYPQRVGHIVGGKSAWHAESGQLDLGYFKTKKLALAAIADEEQYQYAEASCLKHREMFYVAQGCGKCDDDNFAEFQREFAG